MTSDQKLELFKIGAKNIPVMREEVHSTVNLLADLIGQGNCLEFIEIDTTIEVGPFPCRWTIACNRHREIDIAAWIRVGQLARPGYHSKWKNGNSIPVELTQTTWDGLPILLDHCLQIFPYLEKSIQPYIQAAKAFKQ